MTSYGLTLGAHPHPAGYRSTPARPEGESEDVSGVGSGGEDQMLSDKSGEKEEYTEDKVAQQDMRKDKC